MILNISMPETVAAVWQRCSQSGDHRDFVRKVAADGKLPFGMGGEHLVTWPILQELHKLHPDLAVIHIDAHADLREQYEGEPLSHSTPIRKAAELLGGEQHLSVWHPFGLEGRIHIRTRALQFLSV